MNSENTKRLHFLGQQIRSRRKELGVSAVVTAEASGLSRVTLHRIERGEPSVAMGSYMSVATALGLTIDVHTAKDGSEQQNREDQHMIPVRIKLADYPQLRTLAWHIPEATEVTPVEALAIYERNERHLEENKMNVREKQLLEALRSALRERGRDV